MGTASARIAVDIRAQELLSAGIRAGVIPSNFHVLLDLTTGTADGQADLVYATTASGVAASTVTSYDLAGSLFDSFGTTLTFVEVCLIAVRNKRTTALAYLDVGPHATNGFGRLASSRGFWPADAAADADQGSIVAPDSWLVLYAKDGVPVTAGTGDVLRVTTSGVAGSTNTWDLLVIGRSA
jgi:hypothetical protein